MEFMPAVFYFLSTLAILFGLMVVLSPNPVRGALFLVATFIVVAGIWLVLEAEFLGLVLILVYVGAVMTLFLFVVMMLNLDVLPFKKGVVGYLPLAALMIIGIVTVLVYAVGPDYFNLALFPSPTPSSADYSNTAEVGSLLYTHYAFPFEVAGVILLVAIISAISLAFRGRVNRLGQNPGKQSKVDPKDRVRLVKMPAEKKS